MMNYIQLFIHNTQFTVINEETFPSNSEAFASELSAVLVYYQP